MEYFDIPVNAKVDAAVKQYTDDIVKHIIDTDNNIEYEVEYDETTNATNTQKSVIVNVHTEYGFVTIFPDFVNDSAKGSLLNRGMIRSMELEGFDDDEINNATIYGTLMPFSIENAKIFAIVLTRDMGLQHQKNL